MGKPKFTAADGRQWKYVDYERNSYWLTAIYESVGSPGTFIEIDVDFTYQEGETVEGWESPRFESYRLEPAGDGYDYGRAVETALEEAHLQIRERREAA